MVVQASIHSIQRSKERMHFNPNSAEKNIKKAFEYGRTESYYKFQEKYYLQQKSNESTFAVVYNGYCYIFNRANSLCITMFALPKWFRSKPFYDGKIWIRKPQKYNRYDSYECI